MGGKLTLTYTLVLEVEIDGEPGSDVDIACEVASEIQEHIPGAMCDRDDWIVIVNTTELTTQSSLKEDWERR